ncbi:DNA repair helicase XPB [Paenibacillus eucommiae]|uniref:DNA 3'-5' helicase n=1 Tax=Paenibacillus eucommiae TaxID=1355755 RepID=A0ABS4J9E0_9BACL|nr:DNA repair helicase XPB [Paenibacillus eucommiae]MBP1996473.1 DNA excision repair protein ERCC-3 [Paenibacillus eucommiae]
MTYDSTRPLIVQNDFTVLLEAYHQDFAVVRLFLAQFADLIKSPDSLHTYRITPLSLWNAASAGMKLEEMLLFLEKHAKFALPPAVVHGMRKYVKNYGLLKLVNVGDELHLLSEDTVVLKELGAHKALQDLLGQARGERAIAVSHANRGLLKQELIKLGLPALDMAGYHRGEPVSMALHEAEGGFRLRGYQLQAVDSFCLAENEGSGVLVLPCGAGKTIIGIAAMARLQCATLILTTNVTSVRQWKREILEKTNLLPEQVGEYNGARKEVFPVTIATYQILTHRMSKQLDFTHMKLFGQRDWGLLIYDEVHLLPAPVFRKTADIQATRRLGLTATLIREDGREEDVFSLIGPKRFDVPWKELESEGWIAQVECQEIRVPLASELREAYAASAAKQKFRIAGENEAKLRVIEKLIHQHAAEPILIIGQYLDQLLLISEQTNAPMISGETAQDERERLYSAFRRGEITLLIVSKVANFAVDLPDAAVAIQVSGSYGSRQEEAQRLGRIVRPKAGRNQAIFYSIISSATKEQDFALKRQLFLVEQGYRYAVVDWEELALEKGDCR